MAKVLEKFRLSVFHVKFKHEIMLEDKINKNKYSKNAQKVQSNFSWLPFAQ